MRGGMVETFFICGRCGKARKREEVVVVSASVYGVNDGFVAIRCKEHKNAEAAARKAAWRHAQRVKKKMEVRVDGEENRRNRGSAQTSSIPHDDLPTLPLR